MIFRLRSSAIFLLLLVIHAQNRMEPSDKLTSSSSSSNKSSSSLSSISSSSSSLSPPPLPRPSDPRDSLDVFNPSTFSSTNSNSNSNSNSNNNKLPQFSSPSTWQSSWNNTRSIPEESEPVSSCWYSKPDEIIKTSWMALPDPAAGLSQPVAVRQTISAAAGKEEEEKRLPRGTASMAAEERAAEWGLVLRTDTETGKPQGVTVRTSGGEGTGNSRRESGNSVRSSGDESDGGGGGGVQAKGNVPRVSEDLKEVLSSFQQTFVVSDATKLDYPIMYASEGFFKMTGYTSREVIGRNCRFLQGKDTDAEELEKLRGALRDGTSYCGRLLNYKKDGTPFWNLLTVAPIKDETQKVLKFIGMQVEVSKHTEGNKDKVVRPNGLPESLIRYDARQKDVAASAVTELVQAVKIPQALLLSESNNHPFRRSSYGGDGEKQRPQSLMRRNSENIAPLRRISHGNMRHSMKRISEVPEKKRGRRSFMGILKKSRPKGEDLDDKVTFDENESGSGDNDEEDGRPESMDDKVKRKEKRKGLDLATTLERIEKNFVITDPRLPDNPIIFASDSFLELTEYSREEILGRNCRFLQGAETDPETVHKIRQAIDTETEVTVQLINYTKTGKKFWNVFHLQPMRDQKGEVQYFIGVQLDGTQYVEPLVNGIPEDVAKQSLKLVKETAVNVDDAVRELPDANKKPEDLWMKHSKTVQPKPHRKGSSSWKAIQKIIASGEQIDLKHFRPVRPLGAGDTGSVHLVELCGTGEYFAMKAMDKNIMLNRNKVHRACAEREILDMLDHPFLPALYASFQTKTHVCLITDYFPGGELFMVLDRQPKKVLNEDAVRFYAAEVIIALEYLHCQGIIYRDLKPENILLQRDGHVSLTDFDLSCLTSCKPQVLVSDTNLQKKQPKAQQNPIFLAEPMRASNSFVGTEEYIAPEIIAGAGHTCAVDWWALGILLFEMFYGYTPFRCKSRQKTFASILQKDLRFPRSKEVGLHAKQLMYQLLQKDPKSRLGCCEGANEIKRHPFFHGVNWSLIRCMSPPELDAPLFGKAEPENEVHVVDPEMLDLQANIF